MGDRNFATRRGIRHVKSQQGDVIVRMKLTNVHWKTSGQKLDVLPLLRTLKEEETGLWHVWIVTNKGLCPCVYAYASTMRGKGRKHKTRCGGKPRRERALQPRTLEAACYVMVLTTLLAWPTECILGLYLGAGRIRFWPSNALKWLLDYGHLKKKDEQGAKAWLQGKLLLALLIEKLIAAGALFSLSDVALATKKALSGRSRWREVSFVYESLKQAIFPVISLIKCVQSWGSIALDLREPRRKRRYQCETPLAGKSG